MEELNTCDISDGFRVFLMTLLPGLSFSLGAKIEDKVLTLKAHFTHKLKVISNR